MKEKIIEKIKKFAFFPLLFVMRCIPMLARKNRFGQNRQI